MQNRSAEALGGRSWQTSNMQGRCGGQQQQQQQHATSITSITSITSLPEHVLDIIASRLQTNSGSIVNFRRGCKAFRAAGRRSIKSLDLYELCGWGDGSSSPSPQTLLTSQLYPNIHMLILPSGWRSQNIRQLLYYAAHSSRTWRQLSSAALHFHAVSHSTGSALAAYAPQLTQLTLSLDLAFEQAKCQVCRVGALQQLPNLVSLIIEADLRTEALEKLSELSILQQLQLSGLKQRGHPRASLQALASLRQLTSLTFHWQAGRSLVDGWLLAGMTHLQELLLWISGGSQLPPCSSKPLPCMVEAVGQLPGLTRLELLQGLYMSWDLRDIRHLSGLHKLQVLGLHESVLCEEDLALLAPCNSLKHLKVDTIKLPAVRSTVAHAAPAPVVAAAAVDAAAGYELLLPAAGAQTVTASTPAVGTTAALALKSLARLQQLEVNMLQLGLWNLDEVCPHLTSLSPLECTLGAKGHGVVWDLGSFEGHPNLQTLVLMVGALGSTCTCHKSYKAANCAESLAAAVVRVIMQSAGIGRLRDGRSGCTVQQLLVLLRSLPNLQELHLWGHAGGVSGKTFASLSTQRRTSSSSSSLSILAGSSSSTTPSGSAPSSSCSSPCQPDASRCSSPASANTVKSGSRSSGGGVAAVVGDLLSSFGALLSPRSLTPSNASVIGPADPSVPQPFGVSEGGRGWLDGGATPPGLGFPAHEAAEDHDKCLQRQESVQHSLSDSAGDTAHGSSCGNICMDTEFAVQLLQALPQLKVLQLKNCSHLPQGGWDLAVQSCCKYNGAAVVVERQ